MVTGGMERRALVAKLMAERGDALVVSGLGTPSYDVHAAGDRDDNFYLWGAMGGAALTGFGLAQAQPERRVLVVTGDGEMLMALGALATIAVAAPANLDIAVLDNQHFGETGMQESHTGRGVDLAAMAAAAGFSAAETVETAAAAETLIAAWREGASGPRLGVFRIRAEAAPRSLPPRDAIYLKTRFRRYLGFEPS